MLGRSSKSAASEVLSCHRYFKQSITDCLKRHVKQLVCSDEVLPTQMPKDEVQVMQLPVENLVPSVVF